VALPTCGRRVTWRAASRPRIDGRLVLVDIEAGAEDAAGFERVSQGRLVHDRPGGRC